MNRAIGLGGILILVLLIAIAPSRHWIVKSLGGEICGCDTTAKKIIKKTVRKRHLTVAEQPKVKPAPPQQKVEKVEVEISVKGNVEMTGNVELREKEGKVSPPPDPAPVVIRQINDQPPCDSCKTASGWKHRFNQGKGGGK